MTYLMVMKDMIVLLDGTLVLKVLQVLSTMKLVVLRTVKVAQVVLVMEMLFHS